LTGEVGRGGGPSGSDMRYLTEEEAAAKSRAFTVARTETAIAYNSTATAAYRDSGIVDQVEVFDGPECGWTEHDDPDMADGSIRTLDEADEYDVAHPNCLRAFAPVPLTLDDTPDSGDNSADVSAPSEE
jgi:hypothetical protein